VGDETPAVMPEGLDFEGLLVAALLDRRANGLGKTAIDYAEVVVVNGSVFERAGAEFSALRGAAAAEVVEAESGVEPGARGPIEGVAEDESLLIAVANEGKKESGFANVLAGGSGGVGQPHERDTEEAEIGIEQGDMVLDGDFGARRVKLPGGLLGIADGDPGMLDDVD